MSGVLRLGFVSKDAMFFLPRSSPSFVIIISSVQVFRHKMDVSYSESSDYYSLDSYRDFEDFCEVVIRQTVEENRPESRTRATVTE